MRAQDGRWRNVSRRIRSERRRRQARPQAAPRGPYRRTQAPIEVSGHFAPSLYPHIERLAQAVARRLDRRTPSARWWKQRIIGYR